MTDQRSVGARRFLLPALLLLMTALLPASALAETLPGAELTDLSGTTIERVLTRMAGDGYNYYEYLSDGFKPGRIAGMPVDLDGDDSDEYLLITLRDDQAVFLSVYENDGDWALADEVQLYSSNYNSCEEAHDVFLKRTEESTLIFCENWIHEDCIADGAAWAFQAFRYEDGQLATLSDMYIDGTDLSGELDAWTTDEYYLTYRPELQDYAAGLRGYGFRISSVYWNQMICEQDDTLDVLCRMYSWYAMPDSVILAFTGSMGDRLSGFQTSILDCTAAGLRLPQSAYLSVQSEAQADSSAAGADETYLIPDSDSRLLTEEELQQYDKATLALIRNEILARYGYPFQKQQYREYFESKSWYVRDENFTYGSLNSIEMENVERIKKLENQ